MARAVKTLAFDAPPVNLGSDLAMKARKGSRPAQESEPTLTADTSPEDGLRIAFDPSGKIRYSYRGNGEGSSYQVNRDRC